ncbi:MAG: trypsin-like peptidase domain-containing protein [Thermodesulfobacteriota bacterium]|nr:trypsin-like peptidase domain-containing protein [Thermodesulfobacteriota bacterium]
MHSRLFILIPFLSLFFLSSISQGHSVTKAFQEVDGAVVMILTAGREYSKARPGRQVATSGLGSGVVISKDGLLMTAAHVVQVADEVVVEFQGGERVSAKVVGAASLADVALLRLEALPEGIFPAELGDSDSVSIGEEIFVVGAPYGVTHTLTVGHISGRRKPKTFCDQIMPVEFLQTDAAINQGNSGGPMFSRDGKVIGIVSHFLSQSGGFEGLGFAASINTAKELLLRQRPFWTGLEVYAVSGPLAKALNVPQESGLLIQRVAADSPGHYLGLRPGTIPIRIGNEEILVGGDIILQIQGIVISADPEQSCRIRETMAETADGDAIDVRVLRQGKTMDLAIPK